MTHTYDPPPHLRPVRSGGRDFGDSWDTWKVFPATLTESELADAVDYHFCIVHGGPGQAYTHAPYIRRSRTRILVVQSGGFDI